MGFNFIDIDKKGPSKGIEARRRMTQFIGEDEFKKMYSNNDAILDMIFMHRIKKTDGCCPSCDRELANYKKIKGKPAYRCACGNRVYPLKGTPLEQVRVKLNVILYIVYKIFSSKHGYTTRELVSTKIMRTYHNSQKILRNITDWMGLCTKQEIFKDYGTVQVDEVYVATYTSKVRRELDDSRNTVVYTLIDEKTGLTKVYQGAGPAPNTNEVRAIFEKNFNPTHKINTDESPIYRPLRTDYEIHSVNHQKKEYARREIFDALGSARVVHTNTNERFNRSIKVSTHRVHNGITKKHLSGYIYRMAFNSSYASLNINQAIDKLFESLPPLFIDGVQRTKDNAYIAPEWVWKKAA